MLSALEQFEDVAALRDKFPPDISDADLFRQLKDSDYVFVTNDERQKTREHEARGIKEAGLTALWIGPFWSKKGFWGQAKWIINRWQKIDGYVQALQGGPVPK